MPKIVDHDQKREELLQGCFDLLARRGYSAVSMREVAKELKISTGSLYHYFANKEDLFMQMVSWMGSRDVKKATSMLREGADLNEKIKLLLQFVHEENGYFQQLLFIALDYYRHQPSAEKEGILLNVAKTYRLAIHEELDLPSNVSTVLLSLLIGMVIHYMLDPNHTKTNAYEEVLTQMLVS